jgi:hypothetical protein
MGLQVCRYNLLSHRLDGTVGKHPLTVSYPQGASLLHADGLISEASSSVILVRGPWVPVDDVGA